MFLYITHTFYNTYISIYVCVYVYSLPIMCIIQSFVVAVITITTIDDLIFEKTGGLYIYIYTEYMFFL